jgi:hypothetical protein
MLSPKRTASIVLMTAGTVFILVLVVQSRDQLVALLHSADWLLLAASALVGISSMIVTSIFFGYLLEKHALVLPSQDVNKMFFYGQIAKYIPGKIWGILYQTTAVNIEGATKAIGAANVDLMIISIITSISMAAALIANEMSIYLAIVMFFAGMYATVIASNSSLSGNAVGWMIDKVGIGTSRKTHEQKHRSAITATPIIIYYTMIWITSLLAYYLMMHAVFSFTFGEVVTYVAYLMLAWVVGVFAFLAPAGLGVRELIFITFGAYMIPDVEVSMLATIALVSRLWQVLQELCAAAVIFIWGITRAR